MHVLYLAGLVIVAGTGAAFALENPQIVDFGYFAGRLDAPLSVLLTGAFSLGMLLGALWDRLAVALGRRRAERQGAGSR